jgi:GAF domain-containing protein
MTACVPLVVDGRVTGAVAIFRLLEHKRGLEDVDSELFSLLGTQAATALYCTRLVSAAQNTA